MLKSKNRKTHDVIARRAFLGGAIAAPLVLSLPNRAWAQRRNPNDFPPGIGTGNDTAAINAALAAIRTDGYGVLDLDGKNSSGYQRFYDVGALNAQYCSRSTLQLHSGIVLRGSQMTTSAAMLDYAFAHEIVLDIQGHIYGGVNGPWGNEQPAPATVRPLCGILVGGDADKILIRSPKVTGWFRSTCIGVIEGASVEIEGQAQLIQRQPVTGEFGPCAPPALILSSNPGEWGLQSIFDPILSGEGHVNAVVNFIWRGGEIHQINGIGGAGTGWPIYMRGVQVAAFRDVLIDTSRSAYVLCQSTNSDIVFDGCCFRNAESSGGQPANPVNVFEGNALNFRVYAPSPNNLQTACTGTVWAGTFTGAWGQF